MSNYPLLFTFLDKVEGQGFLAGVKVYGRLLAVEEEDGAWWMYGVNPGGVAASGSSMAEAYMEFRATLMQVLFDLAAQAPDFYAFRAAAKTFFDETDDVTVKEWDEARQQVRDGKVTLEKLKRETAEAQRRIEIELKKAFSPKDNATDPKAAVAA